MNQTQLSVMLAIANQLRDAAKARYNLGSKLTIGRMVDGKAKYLEMRYFANLQYPLDLVTITFERLVAEGNTRDQAFEMCEYIYRRDVNSLLYTALETPYVLDVPGPVQATSTQRTVAEWKMLSGRIKELDRYDDLLEGMKALSLLPPTELAHLHNMFLGDYSDEAESSLLN